VVGLSLAATQLATPGRSGGSRCAFANIASMSWLCNDSFCESPFTNGSIIQAISD
jgi:hypothetical protein